MDAQLHFCARVLMLRAYQNWMIWHWANASAKQLRSTCAHLYVRTWKWSLKEPVRLPTSSKNGVLTTLTLQQCAALFEGLRVRIPGSRPLFDDVLSTLKELQQRGFQLGVVTNRHWGGAIFQEDLQTLGLLDYFDPRHMAISIDLGIRKPNPAIFLHVLHALDVPPEEAAMVGDSLRSDILGAQLLGLFTIWKPSPALETAVYERKVAAGAISAPASTLSSRLATGSNNEDRPGDLPQGMHITDDDYVLAHIDSRAGKWDEHMQREIKPDVRIDTLSDLLDIFVEAGKQ